MSTVIDALVLTLGLDASKFVKGQKEAEASLKKTRESAAAHGADIERSMKASSEGVSKLTKEFLGLFAVFTAGKGVKEFISDVTKNDATLGRFATNLRMSTKDLQSWQGAVESVGGAASDVTSSVQGLSDSFQALKIFGDPGIVKALAIIGTRGGKRIDINKPINQTLLDLSSDLSKIAEKDPAQAAYLGRQIGLTQGLYNVIVKGPAVVQKMLDAQAKYAASTADIDAAEKRQSAWQRLQAAGESFGRTILTAVTPALLKLNELLRRFVEWAKSQLPAVQKAFTDTFGSFDEILANIEKTLGKPNWKEWFETIKGWGKSIDSVAKGLGGWKNTLELLLAIAVMNWLSPIVTAFGLLSGSILSIVGAGPALAALFAVGGPLAALAGLYGLVRPTPANEGEDERARQQRYGQGGNGSSRPQGHPGEDGGPIEHSAPIGGGSGGGGASGHAPSPSASGGRYGPQLPGGGKRRLMGRGQAAGGESGKYRPQYALSDADLSDATVNTIAGESIPNNQTSIDAVINNMLNRVGSKGWGPSGNLEQVARARGQYTGYRKASAKEAELIRNRIRAIASGSEPDTTGGSNQYRAYKVGHGGAGRWNNGRPVRGVGGNNFAYDPSVPNGPYAPYEAPKDSDTNAYTAPGANQGDASQAPGTAPGAGKPSEFNGQKYTDYYTNRSSNNMEEMEAKKWASHKAAARMNLLKGIHPMATREGISAAYAQYRRAIAEHRKALKDAHELELWKRQGEANAGGSSHDHGYGFNSPPGTLGKFSHDKGIIPRHTWQRHFLPDRSPNPDMNHLLGIGKHLQSASLGAGHHINSHNTTASHEVHVGAVNVHTSPNSDASGIVRDIKPALERASFASLGNYSLA